MWRNLALLAVCFLQTSLVRAHCEKVFNCADNPKSHPVEIEFCPHRFPSDGDSIDFEHLAVNLPKGLPHPFKSLMAHYTVFVGSSVLMNGSYPITCDIITGLMPKQFYFGCPVPPHWPVGWTGSSVSVSKHGFVMPEGYFKAHVDIENEEGDLEFCVEFSVEFHNKGDANSTGSTPYVPPYIVKDRGEQEGQGHRSHVIKPSSPNGGDCAAPVSSHGASLTVAGAGLFILGAVLSALMTVV